jgi:hypothetical protein
MIQISAITAQDSGGNGAAVVIFIAIYLTPSIIAVVRKMPNVGSIVVVNVLLGWTVIGWVIALAMALGSSAPRGVIISNVINNSVGMNDAPQQHRRPDNRSHTTEEVAPGGAWARDPYSLAKLRYHDGRRWTEHVSDNDGLSRAEPAEFPPPELGAGWAPDPFGRYAHRYHDGKTWTESVSDDSGATGTDSPTFVAPSRAAPRVSPPPATPPTPPPPSV